jgi:hypothetical protein
VFDLSLLEGLHTLQAEYPCALTSLSFREYLLFDRYRQPRLWYLVPESVIYTVVESNVVCARTGFSPAMQNRKGSTKNRGRSALILIEVFMLF